MASRKSRARSTHNLFPTTAVGARRPGRPNSCTQAVAFELLGLVMRDQRVDDVVDLALHHPVELVKVQADAVVGEPVLGKVVGADFLAAVARADLRAEIGRASCRERV